MKKKSVAKKVVRKQTKEQPLLKKHKYLPLLSLLYASSILLLFSVTS